MRKFATFAATLAALLLLGGAGTVAAASFDAAASDFNHDGRTDLAVLQTGKQVGATTQYRLEIFSGGGERPVVLDTFEAGWHSRIVARDIDGDHDADLVLFSATGSPSKVWINDGSGDLQPEVPPRDLSPQSPVSLTTVVSATPVLWYAITPVYSALPRPAPSTDCPPSALSPVSVAAAFIPVFSFTTPLFRRPPPFSLL